MSKVQIKTEIDLLAILPQLDTSDLEWYAKEIAKLLNIPVGTVKSRIRLGMIKLQSILTKEMVTS